MADGDIGSRYPSDSDLGAKNIVDFVQWVKTQLDAIDLSSVDARIAEAVKQCKDDILDGVGEDYDTLKELAAAIGDNKDLIKALTEAATSHISYTLPQSLSDTQKETARENIGAADDAEVVHIAGSEEVTGEKTFKSTIQATHGLEITDTTDGIDVGVNAKRTFAEESYANSLVIPKSTDKLSLATYDSVTEAKVVGKNLFNPDKLNFINAYYLDSWSSTPEISEKTLAEVKAVSGSWFCLVFDVSGMSAVTVSGFSWTGGGVYSGIFDANFNVLSQTGCAYSNKAWTVPDGGKWLILGINNSSFDWSTSTPQVELGSTATTYVSYTETSVSEPTDLSEVAYWDKSGNYHGNVVGNLTGNADTATKATQDGDGNTISSTYLKTTDNAASATKATQDGNGANIAGTYLKKIDGIAQADILQDINTFASHRIYQSKLDNTLYCADKRLGASYEGTLTGNISNLFDGNFDSHVDVPAGEKTVITIGDGTVTNMGMSYPYGWIYVSFYYQNTLPDASKLSVRVYQDWANHNIGWVDLTTPTEYPYENVTHGVLVIPSLNYYGITKIELTIDNTEGTQTVWLNQVEFFCNRTKVGTLPVMTKWGGDKIWGTLETSGNITAPRLIGLADKATADASGNVISSTYLKAASVSAAAGANIGSVGTPSVSYASGVFTFDYLKGEAGEQGIQGIQGVQGDTGPRGYYFTPSVSSAGVLSWTNNGGLANPSDVSVIGPKGDKGDKGDTGEKGEGLSDYGEWSAS